MKESPFPELSLRAKRAIYWSSIGLFAVYSAIVYQQGTRFSRGAESYTASAQRGKILYQEYNCSACHQIYGLGGFMGPDLTNVITAEGKGRAYANAFLQAGTARMPRFGMSEAQREDLLDYLGYVGRTGRYPLTDYRTTWYGDIDPNPR